MVTTGSRKAAIGLALCLVPCLAAAAAKSGSAGEPVTGPDLVLWLDAQQIDGSANTDRPPRDGDAIDTWTDRSSYGHDARQAVPQQRPTYVRDALDVGLPAVRFEAAQGQHLSVGRQGRDQSGAAAPGGDRREATTSPSIAEAGHSSPLDLPQLTAFVVARAARSGSDMWLFSKNHWGPPWTGYGIAVSNEGLRPWPHLGLETGDRGYFQFGGSLSSGFRIVEVTLRREDRPAGVWTRALDREQAVSGRIATERPGADHWHAGRAVPGRRHRRDPALPPRLERARNASRRGRYLMEKYGLPLSRAAAGRLAAGRRLAVSGARGSRWRSGFARRFGWTRELAARLAKDPRTPDLRGDLAELDALAGKGGRGRQPSPRRASSAGNCIWPCGGSSGASCSRTPRWTSRNCCSSTSRCRKGRSPVTRPSTAWA